ncbi:MAG: transporter [Bacteroidota bacterium]
MLLLCLSVRAQLSPLPDSADTEVPGSVCNKGFCASGCCGPNPTPTGIMISHVHEKGEWMLAYRFMNMESAGMQQGSKTVSDNKVFEKYLMSSSKMQMQMHMLMAMYGLNDRLTIMAMFNYNLSQMSMTMLPGAVHNHGSAGAEVPGNRVTSNAIGDTKLHALYKLSGNSTYHIVGSMGISIPTGSIAVSGSAKSMYAGMHLPYSMQTGSGSLEVLPGITYLYSPGRFSYSAQLTGIIRTNYNSIAYKLGNEANLNAWAAFNFNNWLSGSLRAEGIKSGKISGKDKGLYNVYEPAADPDNYGGLFINSYLGLNCHLDSGPLGRLRLSSEFGMPVYQHVNGIQSTTKNILNLSLSSTF